MKINKSKIGLITTVSNWELYRKTKEFFPPDINYFAVDGTKGLYGIKSLLFFLRKLKKYDLDWLIMADEDVIFTYSEQVFELIKYMKQEDYTVSGMRDGGQLSWRDKNPYLINTYFTVLNLKEIYSIFSEKEILGHQYILKDEFDKTIPNLPFNNYDTDSLFEEYYCFFLWLLRNKKRIFYLQASNPINGDYASTKVLNYNGCEILYHTWYARFYNRDKFHTSRIQKIIKLGNKTKGVKKPIIFKNHYFHFRGKLYGIWIKIKRKIDWIISPSVLL